MERSISFRRTAGKRTPSQLSAAALPTLVALIALLGMQDASAQITAYRNAPGNQQPTVLNAGNGVPVVNVQSLGRLPKNSPGAAFSTRNAQVRGTRRRS